MLLTLHQHQWFLQEQIEQGLGFALVKVQNFHGHQTKEIVQEIIQQVLVS